MDLFVTWDGSSGPDINYLVEYRTYPSTETFTEFSANIHNNYVTIPGLPKGFYEVRISTICSNEISGSITKIGGEDKCASPTFVSYSVLSDNPSFTNIQITYTGGSTLVKLRVTDLSDNASLVYDETANLGVYTISLSKSTLKVKTYKIELLSICDGVDGDYIDMGSYSVERTVGVEIFYTNNCNNECGIFVFTDSSNNSFSNPLSVHRDTYNLNIKIPLGTTPLQTLGTLKVEVYSNNQLFYSISTGGYAHSDGYNIPISGLNLNTGAITGSYVQTVMFTFSCE